MRLHGHGIALLRLIGSGGARHTAFDGGAPTPDSHGLSASKR
jgi:hypothetical protein